MRVALTTSGAGVTSAASESMPPKTFAPASAFAGLAFAAFVRPVTVALRAVTLILAAGLTVESFQAALPLRICTESTRQCQPELLPESLPESAAAPDEKPWAVWETLRPEGVLTKWTFGS